MCRHKDFIPAATEPDDVALAAAEIVERRPDILTRIGAAIAMGAPGSTIDLGCADGSRLVGLASIATAERFLGVDATCAWWHDLRHTHETWLVEDHVPRVQRLQRLGHKRKDIDDFYSHVTPTMRDRMLAGLQDRWERSGQLGMAQPLDPSPDAA